MLNKKSKRKCVRFGKKYSLRYHRPKLKGAVMRVTGRGRRFEFYKKAKRLIISRKLVIRIETSSSMDIAPLIPTNFQHLIADKANTPYNHPANCVKKYILCTSAPE
ncbi:hypothetical protein H206_01886 [Candidatus Electrothrix aarhusensis]|uniref:Uncharacterized protein n=1 Tax=Candidatus Electrothrix aarhusensis TaxID=1859131 RepID=A0A444ITX4_9BACT|nr:hypothetical protein H206_01886 [Candidatus Electrothrix aarhusensis]